MRMQIYLREDGTAFADTNTLRHSCGRLIAVTADMDDALPILKAFDAAAAARTLLKNSAAFKADEKGWYQHIVVSEDLNALREALS